MNKVICEGINGWLTRPNLKSSVHSAASWSLRWAHFFYDQCRRESTQNKHSRIIAIVRITSTVGWSRRHRGCWYCFEKPSEVDLHNKHFKLYLLRAWLDAQWAPKTEAWRAIGGRRGEEATYLVWAPSQSPGSSGGPPWNPWRKRATLFHLSVRLSSHFLGRGAPAICTTSTRPSHPKCPLHRCRNSWTCDIISARRDPTIFPYLTGSLCKIDPRIHMKDSRPQIEVQLECERNTQVAIFTAQVDWRQGDERNVWILTVRTAINALGLQPLSRFLNHAFSNVEGFWFQPPAIITFSPLSCCYWQWRHKTFVKT